VAYSADGCVLATTGDYPDPTPLILWDVAYPARPRRTATPFTDLGVDPVSLALVSTRIGCPSGPTACETRRSAA